MGKRRVSDLDPITKIVKELGGLMDIDSYIQREVHFDINFLASRYQDLIDNPEISEDELHQFICKNPVLMFQTRNRWTA